jgi:hypothetical protein
MEEKESIELLRWLIGRSDTMRAAYSNKAALILSADAIILAVIVFLIEKYLEQTVLSLRIIIILCALVSLGFMVVSLIYAFSATITPGSSREATGFEGPARTFLNPAETFKATNDDFDTFKNTFQKLTAQEFIESACAEFWVGLKLQHVRYTKLKMSAKFIKYAFVSLVIAVLIVLFANAAT